MEAGEWEDWDHITKLDPDKDLTRDDIIEVCESGTDAIMVGGTQGITEDKIRTLVETVRGQEIPLTLEPSNPSAVVHDVDWVFVPSVINAGDVMWIAGAHKEWIKNDDNIDWDHTTIEGYVVLNPDSAVAELTRSYSDIEKEDAVAYAEVSEKVLNLPIVYIEYSGTFGDPEIVEAMCEAVDDATVFYGGGIDDYDKAVTMARHADVVIVGNAVYEEGVEALEETVRGAKQQDP